MQWTAEFHSLNLAALNPDLFLFPNRRVSERFSLTFQFDLEPCEQPLCGELCSIQCVEVGALRVAFLIGNRDSQNFVPELERRCSGRASRTI